MYNYKNRLITIKTKEKADNRSCICYRTYSFGIFSVFYRIYQKL